MESVGFFIQEGIKELSVVVGEVHSVYARIFMNRPYFLVFSYSDGKILKIGSHMHDLSDRVEVGILFFEMMHEIPKEVTLFDNSSLRINEIKKFTVIEGNFECDVGVSLLVNEVVELNIVCGNFPNTLAISGIFDPSFLNDSAYEWSSYIKRDV